MLDFQEGSVLRLVLMKVVLLTCEAVHRLIEPLWKRKCCHLSQLLCAYYLSSALKLSLCRVAWDMKRVRACKWLRNSFILCRSEVRHNYIRLWVVEDTDPLEFMNDGPSGDLWQGCHHVPFMLLASCSLLKLFLLRRNLYLHLSLYMKHVIEGHVLCIHQLYVHISSFWQCFLIIQVQQSHSCWTAHPTTCTWPSSLTSVSLLLASIWSTQVWGEVSCFATCNFFLLSLCFHVSVCHLSQAATEG